MSASIKLACSLAVAGFSVIPSSRIFAATIDLNAAATPGHEAALAAQPQGAANFIAPASVFVPDTSRAQPGDEGRVAHTNYFVKNVNRIAPHAMTDLRPAPACASRSSRGAR